MQKVLLTIDLLLAAGLTGASYTDILHNADLTISVISRLAALVLTVIMIFKHKDHALELLEKIYSLTKK